MQRDRLAVVMMVGFSLMFGSAWISGGHGSEQQDVAPSTNGATSEPKQTGTDPSNARGDKAPRDQPSTETFHLDEELARDLGRFLHDHLGDEVKVRVRRRTPWDDPNPTCRLDVITSSGTKAALQSFIRLFLHPVPITAIAQVQMENYLRASGRQKELDPPKPKPKPRSQEYQLSPKKARAIAALIHKHGRWPVTVKAKLGTLTVTAVPEYHDLLKPMLMQLGLRSARD